jgi:hypothetical protein
MHSLARLRFPTKDLYLMISKAAQSSHSHLLPKDSAILLWAYTRIMYFGVDQKAVGRFLASKVDSPFVDYLRGEDALWLDEASPILGQIQDSVLLQEVGPNQTSFEPEEIDGGSELKRLLKYNREVDENFNNFYFINPQVMSLSAYATLRGGTLSTFHENRWNDTLSKNIRDFDLRTLAVTINGKFGVNINPPTEWLDNKILRRLYHVSKDLTLDKVYLMTSIAHAMCIFRAQHAKQNLKAYRVRSYLNVITPATVRLLENTVL